MEDQVIARSMPLQRQCPPEMRFGKSLSTTPPPTSANKKMRTNSVAFLLEDAHDLVMFETQETATRSLMRSHHTRTTLLAENLKIKKYSGF